METENCWDRGVGCVNLEVMDLTRNIISMFLPRQSDSLMRDQESPPAY
jgi:hypothetical protein